MKDSELVPAWDEMTAEAPNYPIRREGAMLTLLFAAKTMGYAEFNQPTPAGFLAYAPKVWDKATLNYPIFDWNTAVDLGDGCADANHFGPAYDFCLRRISVSSMETLLVFDENGDLRLEQRLTLAEAVLSALRLYESDDSALVMQADNMTKEQLAQALAAASPQSEAVLAALNVQSIELPMLSEGELNAALEAAGQRKQAILNSPTTITLAEEYIGGETYTGTAYYISNSGSDANNGLTPETALATMEPLSNISLAFGDAIFFERGSLWRGLRIPDNVVCTPGITYSAYGQGDKPKFFASPENGGGAEKWTLYYEGANGEKVWTYYQEMTEVAGMVLDGEIPVRRDTAYWFEGDFYTTDSLNNATVNPYVVTEELTDMACFPALNYTHSGWEYPAFISQYDDSGRPEYLTGALYFRCDAGNPGELYRDIEFISPQTLSDGFSNYTVYDNLCIMYASGTLTTGSANGVTNDYCVIQNCEVAWMGGHVASFATGAEEGDVRVELNDGSMGRMGGCISVNGSHCTVRDNYTHHGFDEGIAIETFIGDPPMTGNRVCGNLIDSCVQSLIICNWDMEVDPNHIITDCVFEDNYVLYSGRDNWENDERYLYDVAAIKLQGGPCANQGLSISNNLFAFSDNCLLIADVFTEEYTTVFSNNTYIQDEEKPLLKINEPYDLYEAFHTEEAATALGDQNPTFYFYEL